jgi:hypothetical protein
MRGSHRLVQGDATGWMATVRLAGDGCVAREVGLEGLWGATRVEEVLRLANAALGVRACGGLGLRCGSRLLRGEATLAEAWVGVGGVGEVWVGEAGGMPVGCFGFGGQQQTVNELRLRVVEAEAEARRHAEAEARLQAEVELLRTRSSAGTPAPAGAAAARVDATVQQWPEAPSLAGVLVGRLGDGFQGGKVSSTADASTLITSSKYVNELIVSRI